MFLKALAFLNALALLKALALLEVVPLLEVVDEISLDVVEASMECLDTQVEVLEVKLLESL